jgi:hypothetical protein
LSQIAKELRERMAGKNRPSASARCYITLSVTHSHTIIQQHMNIHTELVKKIHELVEKGFNSVRH